MKISIEKIKKSKTTEELLEFSIINLDKPSGPTSFTVSQFVRTLLKSKKTAHLGTLDPAVTGVLPVALNRACRLNEYLMKKDKSYVGIMRVHKDVDDETIKKEMKALTGKVKQLPPKRSAVKRAVREREVKKFEFLEREEKNILFFADVEAGTYIRTLCDDIGKKIGGAHMLELRRTKAGLFSEDDKNFINLYHLEKAVDEYKKGNDKLLRDILIPGEIVAEFLPVLKIRKDVLKKVYTGSPIFPSFLEKGEEKKLSKLKENEKICTFCEDKFVGCYNFIGSDNLIAKPEFVFN